MSASVGIQANDQYLYHKVESQLCQEIAAGEYELGEKLPDERRLAKRFSVSRSTVRQAMENLLEQRLVDRMPGKRGLFVRPRQALRGRYLHVVGLGWASRTNINRVIPLSYLQRSIRKVGARLCVHFADDFDEVRSTVAEISQDSSAIGGVLLGGGLTESQTATAVANVTVPWIQVGDFAETKRGQPIVDQIVGDSYRLFEEASQRLVQMGCKRASLMVFREDLVWNSESISAYRAVFDAAGISAIDQQVVDLQALRSTEPHSIEEDWQVNLAAIDRVIDRWRQTDRWPEGIILSPPSAEVLEYAVSRDEQARKKLGRTRLILCGAEEYFRADYRRFMNWPVVWVVISCTDIADLILTRLQEQGRERTSPVRRYVRTLHVHEEKLAGKIGSPFRKSVVPSNAHLRDPVINDNADSALVP